MGKFAGKTILITGAGKGIGRLLAERLIKRGGYVIAWDIDQTGLQSLQDTYPDDVDTYLVDLSQKTAVQETAQQVLYDHGGVDILVNNAGIVQGKSILDCDDEAIERTFAINILAHFWTVRAFLPGMIERGYGHIVTVASAGGLIAATRLSDYSSSKFAAFGFDEALRMEFKRFDLPIKTTVVCPYYVNTGMFSGVKTRFSSLLPILEPQDVADRMVRAIEKEHKRLIMPPLTYIVFPARLLPVSLFDTLVDFFGISKSMEDFIGHGAHE